MAGSQGEDVKQTTEQETQPGFFARRFLGLLAALAIFVFALLHEPREEWSDQVFGFDESTVFGLIMAMMLLIVNEIWVRWIAGRLSSLMQLAVIIGFAAPIGYVIGQQSAGFRIGVLNELEAWVVGLEAIDIFGLALGALFIFWGVIVATMLSPKAREAADLTQREQGQLVASLPIMLGEGTLLVLLVMARQLDWSAPGFIHGVILFIAGAAFLASIWFSASVYGKLDELERNLVYRQTTVTFLIYFFVLAGWALAEAIGLAPSLDAYSAFLMLNAVYIAIATPWSLWHARDEIKEA